MDWNELLKVAENEVAATVSELPEPVRAVLRDVPVLIENRPDEDDVESGIEPDTLGFYDEDAAGAVRIRLWIENIRDYAEDSDHPFAEEVRVTLLHEIGHVLGWDEEDLDDRGLG
ncbi:MAG: metallopeptidase family protein [Terrimicrobiaceae bacterium]